MRETNQTILLPWPRHAAASVVLAGSRFAIALAVLACAGLLALFAALAALAVAPASALADEAAGYVASASPLSDEGVVLTAESAPAFGPLADAPALAEGKTYRFSTTRDSSNALNLMDNLVTVQGGKVTAYLTGNMPGFKLFLGSASEAPQAPFADSRFIPLRRTNDWRGMSHVGAAGVPFVREGADYVAHFAYQSYSSGQGYRWHDVVVTLVSDSCKEYTVPWTRHAGRDALGTMIELLYGKNAQGQPVGMDNASVVVVATKDGYWDALAASGLAGTFGAPVLLTDSDVLSRETRNAIIALDARLAVIVGGEAAISTAVETEIESLVPGLQLTSEDSTLVKTKRLAGETADQTALEIAKYQSEMSSFDGTLVVATINGYYDSLSIAPEAYTDGFSILLTRSGMGDVSDETKAYIKKQIDDNNLYQVVILGGEAAVSAQTELGIRDAVEEAYGPDEGQHLVTRIGGANAWETSTLIAEWGLKNKICSPNGVAVADGNGYWDALTGAPFCSMRRAPLLLVPHDGANTEGGTFTYDPYCIDNFVAKHRGEIFEGFVYGGTAAVPESTVEALKAATR